MINTRSVRSASHEGKYPGRAIQTGDCELQRGKERAIRWLLSRGTAGIPGKATSPSKLRGTMVKMTSDLWHFHTPCAENSQDTPMITNNLEN